MRAKAYFAIFSLMLPFSSFADCLPNNFVHLKDIDSTIIQEMRYATSHNFIGRPIKGYKAPECILTKPAAEALHRVQQKLLAQGMSLKVYDCYRPQMAVDDFIAWSKLPDQQQMKNEFYPRVDKKDFFKLGYVAAKSGHTRGSTMDLTIVKLPAKAEPQYQSGQTLVACHSPKRFADNSIEMGTGFDCMDELSHGDNQSVSSTAYQNRHLLQKLMVSEGFMPLKEEWWHFTLKDEPYPDTYFNCPVR